MAQLHTYPCSQMITRYIAVPAHPWPSIPHLPSDKMQVYLPPFCNHISIYLSMVYPCTQNDHQVLAATVYPFLSLPQLPLDTMQVSFAIISLSISQWQTHAHKRITRYIAATVQPCPSIPHLVYLLPFYNHISLSHTLSLSLSLTLSLS